MKKIKNICLVLNLVFLLLIGSEYAYAEPIIGTVSEDVLDIISERVEKGVEKGDKYIDFTDLQIYIEIMSDAEYSEYDKINDVICAAWTKKGFFTIGDMKEAFCYYKIITEPTEEAIEIGNTYNMLMGVEIDFNNVYRNEDGTGNIKKIAEDKATIKKEFETALSMVNSEMSDFDKALVLHDYLVAYVNYPDPEKQVDGVDCYKEEHYTMAELLCRGEGVCCAYARVYRALLDECNIPAITVDSTELNHEWNMIYIDGNWYHVDVTWDDEKYIMGVTSNGDFNGDSWDIGAVIHTYFLLTDTQMKECGRVSWNLGYKDDSFGETQDMAPFSAKEPYGIYKESQFFDSLLYWSGNAFNFIDGYWYVLDKSNSNIAKVKANDLKEYGYLNIEITDTIKYVYGYEKWLFICTEKEIHVYDTEDCVIDKVISPSDISQVVLFNGRQVAITEMCITADTLKIEFAVDDEISEDTYNMSFEVDVKKYIDNEDETSKEETTTKEDDTTKEEVTTKEGDTTKEEVTTKEGDTTKEEMTTKEGDIIKEEMTTKEGDTTKEEVTTEKDGNSKEEATLENKDNTNEENTVIFYVVISVVATALVCTVIGIIVFKIKKNKNK